MAKVLYIDYENVQAVDASRSRLMAMHLAGTAAILLWRGYYFFTVVVIPALGWR